MMVVYKVEFTRKQNQVPQEVTQEHLSRLQEAKEAGIVVFGGAFTDGSGGMTIFRAGSPEEAQNWVEQDVFVRRDTHNWQLRELDQRF